MDRIVKNRIILEFDGRPENVSLSRVTVAALATQLSVTISELEEIKVATSEAVSNAIIHGYQNNPEKTVRLVCTLYEDWLEVEVKDEGVGIKDIKQALQPAFSSDPERMGLGFVFMQSFMDEVVVDSKVNLGTTVTLRKKISGSGVKNKAVS